MGRVVTAPQKQPVDDFLPIRSLSLKLCPSRKQSEQVQRHPPKENPLSHPIWPPQFFLPKISRDKSINGVTKIFRGSRKIWTTRSNRRPLKDHPSSFSLRPRGSGRHPLLQCLQVSRIKRPVFRRHGVLVTLGELDPAQEFRLPRLARN